MNYQKYTWICPGDCDALIEYTFKDGYGWPNGVMDLTCRCGTACILLSVVDATIPSTTTTKEEKMETTIDYNPNALVTYKKIDGEEVSYVTDKVVDIEYALHQSRRNYKTLTEKQNEWYRKESQLRTFIHDNFEASDDQEALTEIAEMFDIPLTKEIEATVWVRVDVTVEVELGDGAGFDAVEEFIAQNLTVDSYGSEMSVTNFDVERVEEGAY